MSLEFVPFPLVRTVLQLHAGVVDDPLAPTIASTNEEYSTVVMQNESPAPHLDGLNDYPSDLLLRTPTPVAKPSRKRVKTAVWTYAGLMLEH